MNNVLLDITDDELEYAYEFVQVILGGIAVDVDVEMDEIKVLLRKSLRIYLAELNNFYVRNNYDNIQGTLASVNYTNRFVFDNQLMAKRISDWFASFARIGGKIPIQKDYIEVVEGKQIYNLATDSSKPFEPGSRVYHKVMWHGRPEINNKTGNLLQYSNIFSFGQAGLNNFSGYALGFLGNLFDTVLIASAIEQRKKVLQSGYFYNINGDIVEFTPRPDVAPDFHAGDRIFYFYFNSNDLNQVTPADKKYIVGPHMVQIDEINWSELNSMAKNWVEDYMIALAKYVQASKWRRIRTIASPNSEYQVELDYASLLDEAKTELEALKTSLREELAKMDKKVLMADKAEIINSSKVINNTGPRPIIIG